MGKLQAPGIDLYEQQQIWVRIFESLCKVAAARDATESADAILSHAWEIYESLGKS